MFWKIDNDDGLRSAWNLVFYLNLRKQCELIVVRHCLTSRWIKVVIEPKVSWLRGDKRNRSFNRSRFVRLGTVSSCKLKRYINSIRSKLTIFLKDSNVNYMELLKYNIILSTSKDNITPPSQIQKNCSAFFMCGFLTSLNSNDEKKSHMKFAE